MVTEGTNRAETWRVVLASGEVREYDAFFAKGATWRADDARRAVMALAANDQLSVAEILAPGEPTRAELLAQLAADDPAKDDTDEAHPAWWRGYHADKGELATMVDVSRAEARAAHARVALLEAERDEARAKQRAAEAEVTRRTRLADTEADATRAQWRADDETIYALRAEVTRLRALMAGRAMAPTREEFDALGALGATLRVRWPGGDDEIPTHGDYYWTAIATVPEGARWWAHGANGALIEWPKVTP